MAPKTLVLTALALCCFAANSLLCRLALADEQIDASSFTSIRLGSGAVILAILAGPRGGGDVRSTRARWMSAVLLFAYAAPFSFAYVQLGATIGALVLFGFVQVTMLSWGILRGERPGALAWFGIVLALVGLVGLTVPRGGGPDTGGLAAMMVAGVAWGAYSLQGRTSSGDPLTITAGSFLRSLPFAALLAVVSYSMLGAHASVHGVLLAIASGALASGVGYSIWYTALPKLSATQAAIVQLLTPVLAAIGAIAWLNEPVTLHLLLTSAAILVGVALTIWSRSTSVESR